MYLHSVMLNEILGELYFFLYALHEHSALIVYCAGLVVVADT